MADHDPLCIWHPGHAPRSGCIGSIAEVRERLREQVEALRTPEWGDCEWNAALGNVLALLGGESDG
jgi:hypothetical protein